MYCETLITPEGFVVAAKQFCKKSTRIGDTWSLHENKQEIHKSYVKKEAYLKPEDGTGRILKAEYVVFYNLSYGVPSFSFNIWNSSGELLTLEDVRKFAFINFHIWNSSGHMLTVEDFRKMALLKINFKQFFSMITQQEHPVFLRPYFVMHPCHTAAMLTALKENSRNIIVTFLSLVTPLLPLSLSVEYGN